MNKVRTEPSHFTGLRKKCYIRFFIEEKPEYLILNNTPDHVGVVFADDLPPWFITDKASGITVMTYDSQH